MSWPENAVEEGELDLRDAALLRDIVARIGVADVQEFGPSWVSCKIFYRG